MKYRKITVLIAVITVVIAMIVSLYVAGFRITYDPNLITDWDAVSGCAGWAGVIASVVAIWYAIQVPKKIADRQDKIALFEKRYDVLQSFSKCRIFYLSINQAQDFPGIYNACCRLPEVEKFSDMTEKDFAKKAGEFQYIFNQIPFLFTDISSEATANVYDSLWGLLSAVVRGEETDKITEKREIYLDAAYAFNQKYFPKMIEETEIKNLK